MTNVKKYDADLKRWREDTDGVYEACVSELRKRGGPIWTDSLCQADIIGLIVQKTRDFDRGRK